MNTKKNFLFHIVSLLMTFFVPNYAMASTQTTTCPTLEAVSDIIPSYALSDNGHKVTICHNTSSITSPFNVMTISTSTLNIHLNNHGDYFSKTGACPTDAVPCPPLVSSCLNTEISINGVCVPTVSLPTIDSILTDDSTPTIVGITSGEPVVTDNIAICDKSKTPHDQLIPKSNWVGSKEGTNYYLGSCVAPPSAEPKPKSPAEKDEKLPDESIALTNQYASVPPNEVRFCNDGGVKSDSPKAMNVTIKRATIVNASTEGGIIDLVSMPTKIKYGLKIPAVGTMDITAATIIKGNKTTGATLTGVTIDDVYIDTVSDFVGADGNLVSGSTTYIKVTGGTTQPTTTKEDGTTTKGIITSGVITSGQDANGRPVRGAVTSGLYDSDVVNAAIVVTQGRRARGKLTNATITNATTISSGGVTVVDAGNITRGELVAGSTSPVSTFGTVLNATLTDASIANSNHCFSSGKVGSEGQLNWKEVVK